LKKYESKILEILDDGSAVLELPEELCKEVGWELGDDLIVKMENGVVTLRKSNGSKPTN
jgi:antitoxin component of MazEF toxin-antitoxin module